MDGAINRAKLDKLLIEVIEKQYTIDLKLDYSKEITNLEPIIILNNIILRCLEDKEVYLSSITRIRIYDKDCKLLYNYEVIQNIDKMTKKKLIDEVQSLRETLIQKDIKIEVLKEMLINKKDYFEEYKQARGVAECLKESIRTKNARGAGRKPYSDFDVVKKIFDYYIDGYSTNKIADILNINNNVRSWSKANVRVILLNPYYIDKCIDKTMFDKVKETMKNKPKGRGKKESN